MSQRVKPTSVMDFRNAGGNSREHKEKMWLSTGTSCKGSDTFLVLSLWSWVMVGQDWALPKTGSLVEPTAAFLQCPAVSVSRTAAFQQEAASQLCTWVVCVFVPSLPLFCWRLLTWLQKKKLHGGIQRWETAVHWIRVIDTFVHFLCSFSGFWM